MAGKGSVKVEIPGITIKVIKIKLVGDSPLVCHRFSTKAKRMMLDKQMGKARQAKPKKDPNIDYEESLYKNGKGYGFPALAFKNAMVDACSHVSGVTKVAARGAFHVMGDLVPITGKPLRREDTVRIAHGTADIRYRGEFPEWSVVLTIRYNSMMITAEQIVNLANTSGFAIGIGEYRPQRNGNWGMYHVA